MMTAKTRLGQRTLRTRLDSIARRNDADGQSNRTLGSTVPPYPEILWRILLSNLEHNPTKARRQQPYQGKATPPHDEILKDEFPPPGIQALAFHWAERGNDWLFSRNGITTKRWRKQLR